MYRRFISLTGIIILLTVSLHTGFSHQKTLKSCRELLDKTEELGTQSYIWIDYSYRDRPLQYWIMIEKSGEIQYVRYDNFNRIERDGITYPKVIESKSGRFSSYEIQRLFELAEREGFFQLESNYSGKETEVLSEDDILKVCASIEGEIKIVDARPPSFIPEELSDIVEAVKGKIPSLQEDGRLGMFLKAEVLNETRAKNLEEKITIISFSEKELKDHLYLKKAIENPGQFIHVGPWKNAEIKRYIGKYNFFLVAALGKKFQVDIFLREKPSKVQ